ncbi:MAG: hypothetical protein LH609_21030 [Rudanella sp.]|nr:hypothetical protein [Rudanella sp.]
MSDNDTTPEGQQDLKHQQQDLFDELEKEKTEAEQALKEETQDKDED